jgi:hypothetical protein
MKKVLGAQREEDSWVGAERRGVWVKVNVKNRVRRRDGHQSFTGVLQAGPLWKGTNLRRKLRKDSQKGQREASRELYKCASHLTKQPCGP